METIGRLRSIILFLAVGALVSAVFSLGFTLGLSIEKYREEVRSGISFAPSHGGADIYGKMAFLYFGISVCLLVFIFFIRKNTWTWSKIVGIALITIALIQGCFLLYIKPAALPSWVTDYSSGLSLIWYLDLCLLASLVGILFIYCFRTWLIYSPSFKSPSLH